MCQIYLLLRTLMSATNDVSIINIAICIFSEQIDELNSFWGSKIPCDYFSFVPLLESIVALVWLKLFIMCGNGGRSTET